jgi:hypothetical protein
VSPRTPSVAVLIRPVIKAHRPVKSESPTLWRQAIAGGCVLIILRGLSEGAVSVAGESRPSSATLQRSTVQRLHPICNRQATAMRCHKRAVDIAARILSFPNIMEKDRVKRNRSQPQDRKSNELNVYVPNNCFFTWVTSKSHLTTLPSYPI